MIADLTPDPEQMGVVRIGREEWNAETPDQGHLAVGTRIEVLRIEGTRVVVKPIGGETEPG